MREDSPPFYVIHGVNDTLAPIDQARQFVTALQDASDKPVAYSELHGTQHAFDVFPSIRSQHSVRGVDRFLRWAYDDWKGQASTSGAEWEDGDPLEKATSA